MQGGLLKSPVDESPTNPTCGGMGGNALSQATAIAAGNIKDASPFKEIMQTLEKPPPTPPSGECGGFHNSSFASAGGGGGGPHLPFKGSNYYNSPPRSADYYSGGKRGSFFFQNFGSGKKNFGHSFRLPRSASMRTPSPPPTSINPTSPPPAPSRPLAPFSTPGSFQVIQVKIRNGIQLVLS